MLRALILFAIAFPAIAFSTEPAVVITDAGYFVLTQSGDGTPILTRASSVADLRTASPPDPNPDPPNPPNPPTPPEPPKSPDEALSVKADEWARGENDRDGAGIIATIYQQVGEAVQRGEVPPDNAANVTKSAAESLVKGWETFRTRVGSEAAEKIATGGPMDAAKMSTFLIAISQGVERSADKITLEKAVEVTAKVNELIGKK
jgi:hypothetical protein